MFEGIAALFQLAYGFLNSTFGKEGGLTEPRVECDAERVKVRTNFIEQSMSSAFSEIRLALLKGYVQVLFSLTADQSVRDRFDIGSLVSVFGKRHVVPERLLVPRIDREGKAPDLSSRVIDIEFPFNGISYRGEQVCERVSDSSSPAVADMERTGWVRAHVLQKYLFFLSHIREPISAPLGFDVKERLAPAILFQEKIDEPWPCDLCSFEDPVPILNVLNDNVRNIPRWFCFVF